MDRLFAGLFARDWLQPWGRRWPAWGDMPAPTVARVPRVDVIGRDEVPGVEKNDLDISVTDSTVVIKGTMRHEEKEETGDYYRCEIPHGAFARSVALPGEVYGANATASFKDGILELTLLKIEKSKRHTVTVD